MPRYVVRHGVMRNLGVFTPRGRDTYVRGDQVIARTNRGLESGEVLVRSDRRGRRPARKTPSRARSSAASPATTSATSARCSSRSAASTKSASARSRQLNLDMQLVDVEHLYGGERVVIYYLAEDRIDFRDLVKTLATEFQTRIEMRQIGVRDEAKLLADYGDCGKPVCCNTHLSEMPPVSMKMAKLQRATLDPSKISGRCGRLKCCLRYEYDTYQDLQRDLPPVGADIITNTGRARVLAQEILAGQVLVETEDSRRIVIDAADVLTVLKRERKPRADQPAAPDDRACATNRPPKNCRPTWRYSKTPSSATPTRLPTSRFPTPTTHSMSTAMGRRLAWRLSDCRQHVLPRPLRIGSESLFAAANVPHRLHFFCLLLPKTPPPPTMEAC